MPHTVTKQRGQEWVEIHEYFLTDLVELMSQDGLAVSLVVVDDSEVTGVDTPESLQRVQNAFAARDGRPVRGLSTGSG
jgi:bifunctional N-acetylglucosamine-1-phosphate-uridyltransferase/glucosamine-1-phosphate-acetyltransferase GlmU-like protein